MTLPDPEVLELLQSDFVVGWNNIEAEGFVGLSHGYRKDATAVGTTNGAGGRNVQIVVMAPDRTVLEVLPGFWHPDDLRRELRFCQTLYRLWTDQTRTLAQKRSMFAVMQRAFLSRLPLDTIARSDWQSFDRAEELMRLAHGDKRDTAVPVILDVPKKNEAGAYELKPLCQLVHERMLRQPFSSFDDFDMRAFTDYGRVFYDNNAWLDKGKAFPKAEKVAKAREDAQEKARIAAAKAAAKAAKARH